MTKCKIIVCIILLCITYVMLTYLKCTHKRSAINIKLLNMCVFTFVNLYSSKTVKVFLNYRLENDSINI